jgi:cobalamin biosynthesis Co2+ chelatase CbiK
LKEIITVDFETEPKITHHLHSKAFDNMIVATPHLIPQSTVYEGIDACLKFTRMPKLTPLAKHTGIPYQWFTTLVEQ